MKINSDPWLLSNFLLTFHCILFYWIILFPLNILLYSWSFFLLTFIDLSPIFWPSGSRIAKKMKLSLKNHRISTKNSGVSDDSIYNIIIWNFLIQILFTTEEPVGRPHIYIFFFVERCSRLLCIEHTLTHTITQFYIDELSVIVLIFACVVNL